MTAPGRVFLGDSLELLRSLPDASVDLVYVDPPFNTGSTRSLAPLRVRASENGTRVGFGGRRYEVVTGPRQEYADAFDDYLAFLEPRLAETHRVLAPHGNLYVHLDYRAWAPELDENF